MANDERESNNIDQIQQPNTSEKGNENSVKKFTK